jgi:hypothetical protein
MAISTLPDTTPESLQIEISNGDLEALNKVVQKWNFKDQVSALRFALAVLTLTQNGSLYQTNEAGNVVPIRPTPAVIREVEVEG